MRKLIVTCMLLLTMGVVSAQTRKGDQFINPQFTTLELSTSDNTSTTENRFKIGIGMKGGRFFSNDFASTGGFGFVHERNAGFQDSRLSIAGGLRYYLLSQFFLGGELNYERSWMGSYDDVKSNIVCDSDFYLSVDGGYALFINHYVSIEPGVYWNRSLLNGSDLFGVKLGVGIYF